MKNDFSSENNEEEAAAVCAFRLLTVAPLLLLELKVAYAQHVHKLYAIFFP
jgi:hypothetical protein